MKTLLLFNAQQMSAYRWQAGALSRDEIFAADEAGQQQFAAYLAKNPQDVFSLLINVAEESFQIESIPFVRGADRKALIKRKLTQVFFNAELSTCVSLGHEKSTRKNERILLSALTQHASFAPWLAELRQANTVLSGIYSLPLLTPWLLDKLRIRDEHYLLLSVQEQNLRQSYLAEGKLIFSRLTPLPNTSPEHIAQALSAEALKLQQYLVSQRLLNHDQALLAYLLTGAEIHPLIKQHCANTPTLSYVILDLEQSAQSIGLKTAPSNTVCEPLFLHALASHSPRSQLAGESLLQHYRLRQIRRSAWRLGALALLLCLLLAGKLLFDVQSFEQQTAALRAEAQQTEAHYQKIAQTFPILPVSHEALHYLAERYPALDAQAATPELLYHAISQALKNAPSVELNGIEWMLTRAEETVATKENQATLDTAPVRESAIIRGELKPETDHNVRKIVDVFQQFVESLQSNPDLRIEVIQQPFETASEKTLKGSDAVFEEASPRDFVVRLEKTTRKPRP